MAKDDFFEVDWKEWDAFFRTEGIEVEREGMTMGSPYQLVALQRLRQAQGMLAQSAGWRPTDVFLFSQGKPPRRDLTQVGGLPYRPAGERWPVDPDGRPLRFFAQIRFRESRDLVPEVPADMLLLFCSQEVEVDHWTFEWRNLDLRVETLAAADDCPALLEEFAGVYGHRCRIADVPEAERPGRWHASILSTIKIGGFPVRRGGREMSDDHGENWYEEKLEQNGYFATFSSVQPPYRVPYPWVNDPVPFDFDAPTCSDYTYSLYDMGVFNLHFQADGSIDWDYRKI